MCRKFNFFRLTSDHYVLSIGQEYGMEFDIFTPTQSSLIGLFYISKYNIDTQMFIPSSVSHLLHMFAN